MPKAIFLCIDGGDPAYLEAAETPTLDRLRESGSFAIVQAQVPTVTNVNNVSIITGSPPSAHGITANYYYDPADGSEVYMESAAFLLAPTALQRARAAGLKTALLASKSKLCQLLGEGAEVVVSGEEPPAWAVERAGPREDIYSGAVNVWLLRALAAAIELHRPDVIYCSTTDYIPHKYGPTEAAAQEHMRELDAALARVLDLWDHPIYITADHGMNDKSRMVDAGLLLARAGIAAEVVPIIKDRYVLHHGNQGGAAYVHLRDRAALGDAAGALREVAGIEEAYPREEAASAFDLHPGRIGDLLLLADRDTVFGQGGRAGTGPLPESLSLGAPLGRWGLRGTGSPAAAGAAEAPVALRSHGSKHELSVPLFARPAPPRPMRSHMDPVRFFLAELGEDPGRVAS
ncbi:MAG: alkaline phosphatase family protein [Nitrospinota bacterium]